MDHDASTSAAAESFAALDSPHYHVSSTSSSHYGVSSTPAYGTIDADIHAPHHAHGITSSTSAPPRSLAERQIAEYEWMRKQQQQQLQQQQHRLGSNVYPTHTNGDPESHVDPARVGIDNIGVDLGVTGSGATAGHASVLGSNPSGAGGSDSTSSKSLSTFIGSHIRARMPVFDWLPRYSIRRDAPGDSIAGLTVGLMVIPQALAYAQLATLPSQYGLYAALVGTLLYWPFGTSKDINVGTTAILSLLTASALESSLGSSATDELKLSAAIFLSFAAGAIQIAIGLLRLGVLLDFISHPVISGFTSASAITIAVTQLKGLTGVTVRRSFTEAMHDFFANIRQIRLNDSLFGAGCIVILFALARLKKYKRSTHPLLWLICVSRNVLIVIVGILIAYIIDATGHKGALQLADPVPSGMPTFTLRQFSDVSADTALALLPNAVIIALVGLLETMAVARSFARQNGYDNTLRANQEVLATGVCQAAGSFLGSYPIGGSFSRTAVNSQAGAQTPLCSLCASLLLVLTLTLFTSVLSYIPKSALAAVIISAVIPMVDLHLFVELYRMGRFGPQAWLDMVCASISLLGCLFISVEWGIAIATFVSLFIVLYHSSRPALLYLVPRVDRTSADRAADGGVDAVSWREVDELDQHGLMPLPAVGPAVTPDALLYEADLREHVCCVRIEGNIMFYNFAFVAAYLAELERAKFFDYAAGVGVVSRAQVTSAAAGMSEGSSAEAAASESSSDYALPDLSGRVGSASSRANGHVDANGREEVDGVDTDDELVVSSPVTVMSVDTQGRGGVAASSSAPATGMSFPSKMKGIILDLSSVNDIDMTGVLGLRDLVLDWTRRRPNPVAVHFVGLKWRLRTFVMKVFQFHSVFMTSAAASSTSTAYVASLQPCKSHFHDSLSRALSVVEREAGIPPIYANRSGSIVDSVSVLSASGTRKHSSVQDDVSLFV